MRYEEYVWETGWVRPSNRGGGVRDIYRYITISLVFLAGVMIRLATSTSTTINIIQDVAVNNKWGRKKETHTWMLMRISIIGV